MGEGCGGLRQEYVISTEHQLSSPDMHRGNSESQ